MRVGVFLQVCDAAAGRVFGLEEVAAAAQRAEELGYESVWVMDHPLIDRNGVRVTGHDPFVLLTYIAARTSRVRLGTLTLCTPFHPVHQLARQSAALADASRGRFVLGLGAGWYEPEFAAFGVPFENLVSRFEEQAGAAVKLLRDGRVTESGRFVNLREAEVVKTASPPPVWVAAKGPRMLRLTARLADGWNLAWGGADPGWLREPLAGLRRELATAGRDEAGFEFSAGVSVVPGGAPDERVVTGGADELARALEAYAALGVGTAILSFAPRPSMPSKPEWMERSAAVVEAVGAA